MKKTPKFSQPKAGTPAASKKKTVTLITVIAALLLILVLLLCLTFCDGSGNVQPTAGPTQAPTQAPTIPEAPVATDTPTEPEPTEPQMLPEMAALYAQNPEIVGWITMEDSLLDYPVMYTPEDPQKYDRLDFEGKFDMTGTPYIKYACSIEPRSVNLIVYGHDMRDGTAFKHLEAYLEEDFWEENKTFTYKTLYEEQTYEIIAVLIDKVYQKSDTCFKYYNFIDPQTEEEFNEGAEYFYENSIYDTGVKAEYGDELISLVTCYKKYDKNGRLVVIARRVVPEGENLEAEIPEVDSPTESQEVETPATESPTTEPPTTENPKDIG